MARTIPTPAQLKRIRVEILKSAYYHQNLSREILSFGAEWVYAEQTLLLKRGLLLEGAGNIAITDRGIVVMKKMSGGKVPAMIRIDRGIFKGERSSKAFIVGRSLSKQIFRRVSVGE